MKSVKQFIAVTFLLFITTVSIHADGTHPKGIKLDGTVGNAGKLDLPGPDYEIRAGYGNQAGGNLFYSFQQFNLHSDESATFTGPDSVRNIIGRVTGGSTSWIDGALRSEIPSADMYFLNPAGVMFGPNASLDLNGSFHLSTADYLRMGENDRFYTQPLENEVLSVAAPAAFGFLDDNPASISLQGKGKLTEEVWGDEYENWDDWAWDNAPDFSPGIEVPEGESISIVGGNIEIKGTFFETDDEFVPGGPVGANLTAPDGRINLISFGSPGEAVLTDSGAEVSAEQMGDIVLTGGAVIHADSSDADKGAGSVFIRGSEFVLDNYGKITSRTLNEDGGEIDIRADRVRLQNNSLVDVDTDGGGDGTKINIVASEEITIINGEVHNGTFSEDYGAGDGGDLSVKTKNISISGPGSYLGGESFGTGKGGDVFVEASESAYLTDDARISTTATNWSTGRAGDVHIFAPAVTLETGASVESLSTGRGKGGNVGIHTKELKMMSGSELSVFATQSGNGGNLSVSGPDAATDGDYADTVTISGEQSRIHAGTTGAGHAGTVSIAAKNLSVKDDASVTTSTSDAGNAGHILLNVERLEVATGASIASESRYPEATIYTVADLEEKYELADILYTEGIAGGGDIIVVEDVGDGSSASFINMSGGDIWIQMTGNINTVADITERDGFIDYADWEKGVGDISIAEDAGDGNPATFVYDGLMGWIRIKNVYTLADIARRDRFIALSGDMVRVSGADNDSAAHYTYTGKEWISYENVHTVADLTERDSLFMQKGDIAKVADTGSDKPKCFVYDGEEWIRMYMTGNAGTITVNAADTVILQDDAFLSTSSTGGVLAGAIRLDAANLKLSGSASVTSTSEAVGDAGSIHIDADTITLEDASSLSTATSGQGKGGDMTMNTAALKLKDDTFISSGSDAPGKGGDAGVITIHASGSINMTDRTSVRTSTEGEGKAGNINMNATNLLLRNNASVASESNAAENGGEAGMLTLNADNSVRLIGASALTTEAKGAGGGKIFINAGNEIYLLNGHITSNVKQGEGKGGDVTTNSKFVILNHSDITANAEEGDGGAIFIVTDNYIKASDSKVTATSKRGNDGTVRIEAPDTDVSSDLVILPETLLDASRWMKKPCAARSGEKASRFIIKGKDAAPTAFDDWQPSPLLWIETNKEN